MPAPAPESPVVVAKVPRGLEGIRPAEINAHLESGRQKANELSRVARSSDKMQGQLGDLITTAATRVEQTHVDAGKRFGEVHSKRVIKDKEIRDSKKIKKDLGKKESRLIKSIKQIEQVKAEKADYEQGEQPDYEAKTNALESTAQAKLEKTNKARIEAAGKEATARVEKKALGYGKALLNEWGKTPENVKAKWQKGNLDKAIRVAEEAAENVPVYYAGQEVLVQRIQEQVKSDLPIEDAFYDSAKALRKAVNATRKEELRLAREVDKAVKDENLKGSKRLSADVRGEHVAEDLAIENQAQEILQEMYQGAEVSQADEVALKSAINSAANRVRQLIEKPAGPTGFLKKPLQDSLLTTRGLKEAIKAKDIVDPARKLVYGAMSGRQKSVEDALGCKISVTRDGKERLIAIKLPQEEAQLPDQNKLRVRLSGKLNESVLGDESETYKDYGDDSKAERSNLFASLVKAEFAEDGLRKKLSEVEPGNIIEVRILTKALERVGKDRVANIKLANAKINGINTADGVRTGALRTNLADVAVKGTEAGIAAGIVGGATYLGINQHIDAAHSILAKTNALVAPLKEVIQNGPDLMRGLMEGLKGVDINQIQTAIQSGSTSELFKNSKPFIDAFNKVQSLSQQMNLAPDQITAITNGALKSVAAERMGAMKDLIIGSGATTVTALSFTEGVRKIAGAPGRGVRSLYHHFFN